MISLDNVPKIKRSVEINPIEQPVVLYTVKNDEGKGIAGYALITVSTKIKKLHFGPWKVAMLWHIHTDKKYRKNGYAKTIIISLQQTFDEIISEVESEEGGKLLESTGFVAGMANGVPVKVWYKS